jgi:hypothetical protein
MASLRDVLFVESLDGIKSEVGGIGFLILGASKRAANCFLTFSISSIRANLLGVALSLSLEDKPWPKIVDEDEPLVLVLCCFSQNKS